MQSINNNVGLEGDVKSWPSGPVSLPKEVYKIIILTAIRADARTIKGLVTTCKLFEQCVNEVWPAAIREQIHWRRDCEADDFNAIINNTYSYTHWRTSNMYARHLDIKLIINTKIVVEIDDSVDKLESFGVLVPCIRFTIGKYIIELAYKGYGKFYVVPQPGDWSDLAGIMLAPRPANKCNISDKQQLTISILQRIYPEFINLIN